MPLAQPLPSKDVERPKVGVGSGVKAPTRCSNGSAQPATVHCACGMDDAGLPVYNVVVVGPPASGKTTLVASYLRGYFVGSSTTTSVVDFTRKIVPARELRPLAAQVKGELAPKVGEVDLRIWDTAGQERFAPLLPLLLRGVHVVLVVFSAESTESFIAMKESVLRVQEALRTTPFWVVVAARCDLGRATPRYDAATYADSIGARYVETSARTMTGVSALFEITVAGTLWSIAEAKENLAPSPVAARSLRLAAEESRSGCVCKTG